MPHVVLDAFTFAAPDPASHRAEFLSYLSRLLELEALERDGLLPLSLSARTYDVLSASDSYPLAERWPRERFPQRSDVLRIVYGLVQRLPILEDVTGVADLLVDAFECTPNTFLDSRPSAFRHHFAFLASLVAVDIARQTNALMRVVATTGLGYRVGPAEAVGRIEDVEWQLSVDDSDSDLSVPFDYRLELILCEDARGACAGVDPVDLWLAGHRESAVHVAVHRLASDGGGNEWPIQRHRWAFGSGFVASATATGFLAQRSRTKRLLEAISEIVLKRGLQKSHALRENEHGSSPALVRGSDGAKAMRHDIDDEYHLHYWRSDDSVEFASIVIHNDFSIP